MVQALKIPLLAPSLGSVETLITQPALTSHAGLTPEEMQVDALPGNVLLKWDPRWQL